MRNLLFLLLFLFCPRGVLIILHLFCMSVSCICQFYFIMSNHFIVNENLLIHSSLFVSLSCSVANCVEGLVCISECRCVSAMMKGKVSTAWPPHLHIITLCLFFTPAHSLIHPFLFPLIYPLFQSIFTCPLHPCLPTRPLTLLPPPPPPPLPSSLPSTVQVKKRHSFFQRDLIF